MSVCNTRPVESHSGARENIIAGPSRPPPILHVLRSDREETLGEVSLTIRLGVRGSVVSSPSGVRGGAPAETPAKNGFYAYFRSKRSHLEHPFQYF